MQTLLGTFIDRLVPQAPPAPGLQAGNSSGSRPCPEDEDNPIPSASPIPNTPSKLDRFLRDLENKGTVRDATRHAYTLDKHGYGPDIMEHVENSELVTVGVPAGDAIRMKRAAPIWWASETAAVKKRRLGNPQRQRSPSPEPSGIRFIKRGKTADGEWEAGSGTSLWETGMKEGWVNPHADYGWWYFASVIGREIPVPEGFVPDGIPGEDDDEL